MNWAELNSLRQVFLGKRYVDMTKFRMRLGRQRLRRENIGDVLRKWERRGIVKRNKRYVECLIDLEAFDGL